MFCVHVFTTALLASTGYAIYRKDQFEVLVLRLEDVNENAGAA
jgi:hypothetical protein